MLSTWKEKSKSNSTAICIVLTTPSAELYPNRVTHPSHIPIIAYQCIVPRPIHIPCTATTPQETALSPRATTNSLPGIATMRRIFMK